MKNFEVKTVSERDELLTNFGKETLKDRYLQEGESFQDLFKRVALAYSANEAHAQRLYDYMSKMWFMPSTPLLSNAGTSRGLPISCYLNETNDTMEGIAELWNENVWLAAKGGGIGSYWGNVRSIGEKVKGNGKTSGVIPFLRVQDSLTLAISQGSLRRGSSAVYLPIDHPEIEEFLDIRRPTGGDPNRKTQNIHHGVCVTDDFMVAVEKDLDWALRSPKTKEPVFYVKARDLWIKLLIARIETGEPYILYIDHVNKAIPKHHAKLGLKVKTSNLCSEITLPTGIDHHGKRRTAVCCLSSLNLEYFDEWEKDPLFIRDVMLFLDRVLDGFIEDAGPDFKDAVYSAMRERSVGLGVMGFHSFLQKKNVPFESATAVGWNRRMFKHIRENADAASHEFATLYGACPDAQEAGESERFSNKLAVAPTASISIIAGNSSPGIEPFAANAYTHKTLSGSFGVKNKNLKKILQERNMDTEEVWNSIFRNEGSVSHLEFLTDTEKDIYKTAMEIDPMWVVEHAAHRAPFICQAQSVNLFVPANVSKKELHELHYQAWKKGVKSLYYCRSTSLQRAEKAGKTEECLACQ